MIPEQPFPNELGGQGGRRFLSLLKVMLTVMLSDQTPKPKLSA
jgi:hypothetical protein